jgi:apolipoprotein N-acyltransferase
MHDAVAVTPYRKLPVVAAARASIPTLAEASLIIASALLLILSFPDFELWPLAWVGLTPLLLVVARPLKAGRALVLGWLWGAIFFYGTCWWLTYPMIHYAHITPWLAFSLLLLPISLVALFPAVFSWLLSRLVAQIGFGAVLAAPLLWVTFEWTRYAITGQLWNALGYSQAFHPSLIQTARWGGVYAVSFLLVTANAAVTFALLNRRTRELVLSLSLIVFIMLVIVGARLGTTQNLELPGDRAPIVIAVQPNVPMEGSGDPAYVRRLLERHFELSAEGLYRAHPDASSIVLVVWPESPMNFSYSRDPHLQEVVANFARSNHTSILLNSLEPANGGGEHNSAVMVNEEGRIVAQYDKIRLMPFGEYVPLPRWIPGASSVRGIVGDFTPGSSYTLMPLGAFRVGVFICIEAAYPSIARSFASQGADALINISNDGYLGPTPVMRQHLSNAIFRAVESGRDLVRVTNNGISADIRSDGRILDSTPAFEPAVRNWFLNDQNEDKTLYTRYGDVFVYACALISLGLISASYRTYRTNRTYKELRSNREVKK